jgi:hypothetical protein
VIPTTLDELVTRTARALGLAIGLTVSAAPVAYAATPVVPLGAVHAPGVAGSQWRDRQLLMDSGNGSSFTLYLTPKDQAASDADPSQHLVLSPGETRTLEDAYGSIVGGDGAATIRIVTDDGSDAPILRSYVFNQDGENEFGMSSAPIDDATFPTTGARVAVMTSPAGFRDNLDATSGADGLSLSCLYANGAGGNSIAFNWIIPPNTTQQRSLNALLGFTPEPNGRVSCDYTNGSGILLLARNHNLSNDPARDTATVLSTVDTSAAAYVGKWLPQGHFYLSNQEVRAMINGGQGTRSYARDVADILALSL